MKLTKVWMFLGVVAAPGLIACGSNQKVDESELAKSIYEREINRVDTVYLKRTVFQKQLVSNGRLRAKTKGVLGFKTPGMVVELPVKNGSFVQKGDLIARLDTEEALLNLAQAQVRYQKAVIERQDALITQGYQLSDSLMIPEATMQMAAIRSGYASALSDLRMAEITLERCTLLAPFSGKIANLSTQLYEQGGANFCTLLDDRAFEVDFSILETEMDFISTNMSIELSPLHKPSERYRGRVSEVNPVIDQHGQIGIVGEVVGNQELMDGMNVKIYLESGVQGQFVVPKTAVVIRDNFPVLFKYGYGKAEWVYVDIVMQNSEYYAITGNKIKQAELSEGDCIIVGGNVNLAHGTEVIINN